MAPAPALAASGRRGGRPSSSRSASATPDAAPPPLSPAPSPPTTRSNSEALHLDPPSSTLTPALHQPATTLLCLTPDILAAVMLLLPLHDVCAVARSCSRLRTAAMDDSRLWLPLCESRWGHRTTLTSWMSLPPAPQRRRSSITRPPTGQPPHQSPPPASDPASQPAWTPPPSALPDALLSPLPLLPGSSLAAASETVLQQASRPRTYRMLYRLLLVMEELAGTWRGAGKDLQGSLFHIGWGDGHMEGVQLMCNTQQLDPLPRCLLFRLGPSYPYVVAHVVGSTHCVVKEYSAAGPRPLSAAAEAAASVAVGGALRSSSSSHSHSSSSCAPPPGLLGSSPPSSFSYELAYFMQGAVAGSRGSNRRSGSRACRGVGGAGGSSPPAPGGAWGPPPGLGQGQGLGPGLGPSGLPLCVHTWVRVKQAQQTRKHPLAGLWKGLHGRDGAQVLSVQYDFQGSTARIVGTKVTGDSDVPAGVDSWIVNASPLPLPLPAKEADLIARRRQLLQQQQQQQEEEEAEQDPLAFLQLLEDEEQGPAAVAAPGGAVDVWAPADQREAPASTPEPGLQVVACFVGKGRLGKPGGGSCWVDGRLWQYSSGDMGFCWLLNPDPEDEDEVLEDEAAPPEALLVEYLRLEVDTAGSAGPVGHR